MPFLLGSLLVATIFVSPDGSDLASGTSDEPVQTISRAISLARQGGAKEIVLKGGTYRVSDSLILDQRDSGLTIRSEDAERATITGAEPLDLKPVPASEKRFAVTSRPILVASLPIGSYEPADRGWSIEPYPVHPEILFDQRPGRVARWPDTGFIRAQCSDPSSSPRYEYALPKATGEVWAHGYWGWEWADYFTQVTDIDREGFQIQSSGPYKANKSARFYLQGAPEFLDRPGEYWYDTRVNKVYCIPAAGTSQVEVTVLGEPMIDIKDGSNITIQNVALVGGRAQAIHAVGANNLLIKGCTIQGFGAHGIEFLDCKRAVLDHSTARMIGASAVVISGGDRKNLVPSNNAVRDCEIEQTNRLWRTSNYAAIRLSGVGVTVENNRIHHTPYIGIHFRECNDITIQRNDLYRLCLDADDTGAIYGGRDWSIRGVVIRENYFHDMNRIGGHGVNSVYLDDMLSGVTVRANLFSKVDRAIMIGGGNDNQFIGNLMVGCRENIWIDDRAMNWAANQLAGESKVVDNFRKSPARSTTWLRRYPELKNFKAEDGAVPKGNVIRNNVAFGGVDQIVSVARQKGTFQSNRQEPTRTATITDLELETRAARGAEIPISKIGPRP